jgi:anti-anti-sigma factor
MVVTLDVTQHEVVLAGHLDVHSVEEVRSALHTALDVADGELLVNLADVEVIDATGLGVLVGAHRRAVRGGTRLVLRDVPPRMQRLLRATRLHRVLEMETSPAA